MINKIIILMIRLKKCARNIVALFICLYLFVFQLAVYENVVLSGNFLHGIGTLIRYSIASLLLSITCAFLFLAIRARYRILFYMFFFLIVAILFVNEIYSKQFFSYFPLELFCEYQNLDGLSNSIIGLLEYREIMLFLLFVGLSIVIFRVKDYKVLRWKRLIFFYLICIISLLSLMVQGYAVHRFKKVSLVSLSRVCSDATATYNCDPDEYTNLNGILLRYIKDLNCGLTKRMLRCDEREKIESFFISNTKGEGDFLTTNSSPRNVILIVVESLMSDVLCETYHGKSIMPNMEKYASEGYFNPNVKCQIKRGMSADGQFIYMTGLLPHSSYQTIVDFSENKVWGIGTLLKRLGYSTSILVPTPRKFWQQDKACKMYGIDSLYSIEKYEKDYSGIHEERWLNDKELFAYASFLISKKQAGLERNFFCILTSSTHQPYSIDFNDALLKINSKISKKYACYLEKCNYMDHYLCKFIESLKRDGIYDESLIVIVSDHYVPTSFDELTSKTLPLIILNSTLDNVRDTVKIGQIDVFPTVLNLCGYKGRMYGLGRDVRDKKTDNISLKKKQEISDMILEGDYFNK